jgi:hypothetical protein
MFLIRAPNPPKVPLTAVATLVLIRMSSSVLQHNIYITTKVSTV